MAKHNNQPVPDTEELRAAAVSLAARLSEQQRPGTDTDNGARGRHGRHSGDADLNEAQTLVAPVHAQRSNLNLRQPVLDEIGVSDIAQDSIVKMTFQEESHSAIVPAVRSRRRIKV